MAASSMDGRMDVFKRGVPAVLRRVLRLCVCVGKMSPLGGQNVCLLVLLAFCYSVAQPTLSLSLCLWKQRAHGRQTDGQTGGMSA